MIQRAHRQPLQQPRLLIRLHWFLRRQMVNRSVTQQPLSAPLLLQQMQWQPQLQRHKMLVAQALPA
jgi:hypothetical protein